MEEIKNNYISSENNTTSINLFDKWDDRFMQVAYLVSSWSSCVRPNRQIGAVIVKNKRIIATGYNGAPSGIKTCAEKGFCMREKMNIPSGTHPELCYAAHAEQNAIVQAAKLGVSIDGATLYCTHQPCVICAKLIINSGIKRVVYEQGYPDEFARELFHEANVALEQYKKD
ncbi:MAG TPA: cytidine/deoxycytidylate deaminase family protein [Clostridia bacterium]